MVVLYTSNSIKAKSLDLLESERVYFKNNLKEYLNLVQLRPVLIFIVIIEHRVEKLFKGE